MKQKVKPVKKTTQPKKPTQFAIEMDAKGIGFFLIMGLGAALIVFYLGYTYGKATRDPNAVSIAQKTQPSGEDAKEAEVQKNLKIYDVREDGGSKIEALKRSSEETLNDASRIIAESKQEQAARIKPSKKPKSQPAAAKKDPEFTPQWPDKVEKKKSTTGLYTYQILSTPNIEKATSRVKHLKQRGFNAYRVAAKVNGKLYYRVRVGRGSKSELKSMEQKLKKAISGDGTPLLMRYGQ